MQAFASYEITLIGTDFEVKEAIECIADIIGDQGDTLTNLLDRYYSDDEEDDEDSEDLTSTFEETIEIWQTHDCVWIEDIEKLAMDIAANLPNLQFSISGHIEDCADDAEDEMDFKVFYKSKKLFSQSTDWYWYIHMDDFRDYSDFAAKICDQNRNPRYSKEDYEGFKACADEWYVMDSGMGEFSTNAPMGDPVRIKIKCKL